MCLYPGRTKSLKHNKSVDRQAGYRRTAKDLRLPESGADCQSNMAAGLLIGRRKDVTIVTQEGQKERVKGRTKTAKVQKGEAGKPEVESQP
jgi:hypothetical protein